MVDETKETRPRSARRNGAGVFVMAVLAFSLSLNAFFLVGYSIADAKAQLAETRAGRAALLAEQLNLTQEQLEAFNSARSAAQELLLQKMSENREALDAFWAEAANDAADPQALERYIHSSSDRSIEVTVETTRLLRQFMETLSDEQKDEFIAILRSGPVFQGRFLMADGYAYDGEFRAVQY